MATKEKSSCQQQPKDGQHVRYTTEQLEILMGVYTKCDTPPIPMIVQLIQDHPVLSNIPPRNIKLWFQNRRTREKYKEEASHLQTVNHKLTAMNKLLMEENDRLQKQSSRLVYENGCMRNRIHTTSVATTDTSCDLVVTSSQHQRNRPSQLPQRYANNPAGLLAIAGEALAEFLPKATGTVIEWVQMAGMKPGPDPIGIIDVSHSSRGVAAGACCVVSLEPTKVVEILKNRLSWYRDCRSVDVHGSIPTKNGGQIELMYMQTYAPTALASAHDFWTLRYTTVLEDGSLVICERSLTPSTGGPTCPPAQNFLRAEMLPSGYLIQPCDGDSVIRIVDHIDLDAWSALQVLRPFYASPKILAQKMTFAALHHIRQIALESSGEIPYCGGHQPAVLRTFSQRLSRGFNGAVNGFADDGWSVMNSDGVENVVIAINCSPNKLIGSVLTSSNPFFPTSSEILCAKASMLLQNVPPSLLLRFLREHRSEWADCGVDRYSSASLRAGLDAVPGQRPNTGFLGSQAHTLEHEEFLEVIRLEGHGFGHDDVVPRDLYILQLCSGLDESSLGACASLLFAPIDDESFSDDASLLPSGFHIISVDSKMDNSGGNQTLDLAYSQKVRSGSAGRATQAVFDSSDPNLYSNMRSVLTIAFQFAYENNLRDRVAAMARECVTSVMASVQRIAMEISSSLIGSQIEPRQFSSASPEVHTLAQRIYSSYRFHTGEELFGSIDSQGSDVFNQLWNHSDSIICFSMKNVPVFTFANQAGLDMLETTLIALEDISLDKILDEDWRNALYTEYPKIIQQGYASLPGGVYTSSMGKQVSYDLAVIWIVLIDNSAHSLAFMFQNWSFLK
ncbi:homeobox-leucine zipper protein HOX32-like [Carex rostrata]